MTLLTLLTLDSYVFTRGDVNVIYFTTTDGVFISYSFMYQYQCCQMPNSNLLFITVLIFSENPNNTLAYFTFLES